MDNIYIWLGMGISMLINIFVVLTIIGVGPAKMRKALHQISALHECHLGINAVDENNKPKWWNDREVERAIVSIAKTLEAQRTTNDLVLAEIRQLKESLTEE